MIIAGHIKAFWLTNYFTKFIVVSISHASHCFAFHNLSFYICDHLFNTYASFSKKLTFLAP